MDKLIFKGKEFELIEVPYPRFKIYSKEYENIGFKSYDPLVKNIPLYDCYTLRIKDKYYALKLIE
jgi:hypothetical protein